jgi:hypothetical protein
MAFLSGDLEVERREDSSICTLAKSLVKPVW